MLLDQTRGLVQAAVALLRIQRGVDEGMAGSRDGGINLLAAGALDRPDDVSGVLVDDVERRARAGLPLAADEQPAANASIQHRVLAVDQMTPLARRRCCSSHESPSAA